MARVTWWWSASTCPLTAPRATLLAPRPSLMTCSSSHRLGLGLGLGLGLVSRLTLPHTAHRRRLLRGVDRGRLAPAHLHTHRAHHAQHPARRRACVQPGTARDVAARVYPRSTRARCDAAQHLGGLLEQARAGARVPVRIRIRVRARSSGAGGSSPHPNDNPTLTPTLILT